MHCDFLLGQSFDGSFDGIPPALEARRTRLGESGLLLLRRCLLLLPGCGVLPTALRARNRRTGCRTRACIACNSTDHGTTCGAARTRTRRRARRGGWRLGRRRGLRGLEARLLQGPLVAGRLVLLLLIGGLSLGGVNVLLSKCAACEQRSARASGSESRVRWFHVTSWFSWFERAAFASGESASFLSTTILLWGQLSINWKKVRDSMPPESTRALNPFCCRMRAAK